jgi:hypothetical protein
MLHSLEARQLLQQRPALAAHVRALRTSFRALLGTDLTPPGPDAASEAMALYDAPFAVLSHGCEADPVLNFGNGVALELWERDFEAFTQIPSRLTAEPVLVEARAALLEIVARQGYIDNYSGVRISANGRRFKIARAIVWNVSDAEGRALGQAATFDAWTMLPQGA